MEKIHKTTYGVSKEPRTTLTSVTSTINLSVYDLCLPFNNEKNNNMRLTETWMSFGRYFSLFLL